MLLSHHGARVGSDPGRGWAIVAALGVSEIASYGVLVYAFGVLLDPMRRDLGLSTVAATGAFSLAIAVSGLAAPLVGRLLDRHDPRWLMGGGSLLASVLVLAWSQVGSGAGLYGVFAGIGLAMALVLYEPAFTVVAKWFGGRRTRALTVLTLLGALASLVFSPLTERLVDAHGWRPAVAVLALILAAVTVPLHALVLRRPPTPGDPSASKPDRTPQEAVRERRFWLLAGSFALSSFVATALGVHLVTIVAAGDLSAHFAALAAGLLGFAQIPGRLLFGLLTRALGAGRSAVLTHAIGAAAIPLLLLDQAWSALAFAVLYGIANGMGTLLRATLVSEHYGSRHYGGIAGRLSAVVLAARAAAPLAASLVALAPGHHATLLAVLTVGSLGAAALARSTTRDPQERTLDRQRVVMCPAAGAAP